MFATKQPAYYSQHYCKIIVILLAVLVMPSRSLSHNSLHKTADSFKISATIPSTTKQKVFDSFIEYTWKRGGSLPLTPKPILAKPDEENNCYYPRVVLPVMLREEITTIEPPSKIEYRVANPGWLRLYPVVHDSHAGTVTFDQCDKSSNDVVVVWSVRWVPLWGGGAFAKFFTCAVISKLLKNLVKYCSRDQDTSSDV